MTTSRRLLCLAAALPLLLLAAVPAAAQDREIAERQFPICTAPSEYVAYNITTGRWFCSTSKPAGVFSSLTLGSTLVTRTGAQINLLVQGVAAGYKVARGVATTASASDTVASGLTTVVAVLCSFQDAPVIGSLWVACDIGNQSDTPVAGSFLLKTYKPTATNDATPTAATTFSKAVAWIAIGT